MTAVLDEVAAVEPVDPTPAAAPRSWRQRIRWPRPDPTSALRWVEVLIAVATVALTAPLYAGCFATSSFRWPLIGAAVVGATVEVAGSATTWSRRWPLWRSVLLALAGFLAFLVAAVLGGTLTDWHPTAVTWTSLRDGLIGGWLRLLTSGVPVDVTPVTLTPPVLLAFGGAWAGVTLCLRGRSIALPLLPGALNLLAGLAFGAPGLQPALVLTAVWLSCCLILLLVRSNRLASGEVQISSEAARAVGLDLAAAQRRSLLGRLAFGIPTVAVVVGFGVGGAALLPIATGTHRLDPRALVVQPVEIDRTITPLAGVQGQLLGTDVAVFTVSGLTRGMDRIRVAVLDTFDGATWSTADGDYQSAGHRLPS